jgi:hypothetical protein
MTKRDEAEIRRNQLIQIAAAYADGDLKNPVYWAARIEMADIYAAGGSDWEVLLSMFPAIEKAGQLAQSEIQAIRLAPRFQELAGLLQWADGQTAAAASASVTRKRVEVYEEALGLLKGSPTAVSPRHVDGPLTPMATKTLFSLLRIPPEMMRTELRHLYRMLENLLEQQWQNLTPAVRSGWHGQAIRKEIGQLRAKLSAAGQ